MEDLNEFNDILLTDEIAEKSKKRKRFLIIFASSLLIFVLILLIMKILNSSNEPVSAVDDTLVPTTTVEPNVKLPDDDIKPVSSEEDSPTISNIEEVIPVEATAPIVTTPTIKKPPQQTKNVTKPNTVAPKTPVVKTVTKGKYFIQVGSFSLNAPSKDYKRKIENKGYSLVQEEVLSGSKKITKLYVGPYENEKEAREVLLKVKEDIVKDAFLVKK